MKVKGVTEMLKRLFSAIEAVSGLPRRIMFWGMVPALLLMLAAVSFFMLPRISYEEYLLSQMICKTAVTLFSEGIILGLFIDVLLRRS